MSERPETEHRGHKIYWSDNMDYWVCSDLKIENQSLLKVREKIDTIYRNARKANSVKALILEGRYHDTQPRFREATIIEYVGPLYESAESRRAGKPSHHNVGVVAQRSDDSRPGRSTAKVEDLVVPGPEAEAILAELVAIYTQIEALRKRYEAARKKLPMMTFAHVEGLTGIKVEGE